jgi:molybdopterin molybdotransferase
MRIFTGAALPEGADAVVRQEDTRRDGDDVLIEVAVAPGTAVRRRGEDIVAGTVVLQPGGRVSPADIAVAAAAGSGALVVARRPRVAIVATGDELRPAGSDLDGAQVADSNSPMIAAAVREAGGEPVLSGIASDDPSLLRQVLRAAMETSDLIVSSAGVSVGDHDHVQEVLAELGEIGLWRVAMRPGKPLLIGRAGAVPFIGLPGNPVSSSVTFELFARPAILRLQGASEVHRRRLRVRLGEDMPKPAGLETYARGRLVETDADLPLARSSGGQGSHMLRALVAAEVLLVLPSEPSSVPSGSVVEAIPLR